MSAPQFTPGPWKVFRASNGTLLGIGDADAGGVTDAYGGLWRSGKEMEANASLIAAAPTMFDALYSVRFWLAGYKANGGQFADEEIERIDAALSDARGKPPVSDATKRMAKIMGCTIERKGDQ